MKWRIDLLIDLCDRNPDILCMIVAVLMVAAAFIFS